MIVSSVFFEILPLNVLSYHYVRSNNQNKNGSLYLDTLYLISGKSIFDADMYTFIWLKVLFKHLI